MKLKNFNELTEEIPLCNKTGCKKPAVFKAFKIKNKFIGFCLEHKNAVLDVRLTKIHSDHTSKGLKIKSDYNCWL